MTKEQTSPRRTRLLIALSMAALATACGAEDSDGAAGEPTNDVDGSFGGGAAGAGGAGVDGGASEGLGGQGGSSLPEGPAFDAGPDGLMNNPIDELFADPARSPWDFLGASAQDGQAYVDAAEARDLRLVSRVVPHDELLPTALALADDIAANPPLAVQALKRGLRTALDPDWDDLGRWVSSTLGELFRTADHREGVQAFLEKRSPGFTGT